MKNLILVILLIPVINFYGCSRQNTAQTIKENSHAGNLGVVSGDTVSELCDSIMIVYQDKLDNYWFGSRGHGAYRYNGKFLVNFTKNDGLVSNNIWGIQEDKTGNIYFDTQEGVSKFDGQAFTTLQISDSSANEWNGITSDDLWFKGNWNKNSAYRYDGKTLHLLPFPKNETAEKLHPLTSNATWSPYGIYSTYKDKNGNPWFGTANGSIYRYNIRGSSGKPGLMYEEHLTMVPNGGSFGIRSMFEDKNGKFWFCNTSFRYKIENEDSTVDGMRFIRYQREHGIDHVKAAGGNDMIYFMSITEDNNHDLWMVTYNEGVWHYDWKNIKQFYIKNGTETVTLFSIYKDNHGVLWLGTHDDGAYKFNGVSFEKFRP
jgi:ligand-binding sensor domain-containing protein